MKHKLLIQKGITLHREGKLEEAIKTYKKILRTDSKNLVILKNLAVIYKINKKYQKSINLLKQCIEYDNNDADAHYNLANTYVETKEIKNAEIEYKKVINLNSNYIPAYNNLGHLYHETGKIEKAINTYHKMLEINPDNADALSNLGYIYNNLNEKNKATEYLEKAIKVNPAHCAALYNLGKIYYDKADLKKAINYFVLAYQSNKNDTNVLTELGNLAYELKKYKETLLYYEKVVELKPTEYVIFNNLGSVYKGLNQPDKSIEMYTKCINIEPDFIPAYINLANVYELVNQLDNANLTINKLLIQHPGEIRAVSCKSSILRREKKYTEAVTLVNKFIKNYCLNPEKFDLLKTDSYSTLCFEMGKSYDALKEIDKAYQYFNQANLNLVNGRGYNVLKPDKQKYLNMVKKYNQLTDVNWLNQLNTKLNHYKASSSKTTPIFFVGFPRSGTTLLDQILNSHPEIQVMEEKGIIEQLFDKIPSYPECILELSENDLAYNREKYFERVREVHDYNKQQYLVSKHPLELVHIPFINRLFNKPKIIMAIRHPCDVILSCFMQNFEGNNAMANFNTLEDAVNAYEKIMTLWIKYKNTLSLNYCLYQYESLIQNFDKEMHGIIDFLGLEWSDDIKQYNKNVHKRGFISTPSYQAVSQPIYQDAKYRWKRYEKYFEPYMERLTPFLKEFGYIQSVDTPIINKKVKQPVIRIIKPTLPTAF